MEISQNRLARVIEVPPRRINEIVLGKRRLTADTAMRLARAFGTSEHFWLGLQADSDLEQTRLDHGEDLMRIPNIAASSGKTQVSGFRGRGSGVGVQGSGFRKQERTVSGFGGSGVLCERCLPWK